MLATKQPKLEQIKPSFGTSIVVHQFTEPGQNKEPLWHVHPEVEFVYLNGGTGKRYIGNHQSYYKNGDLLLIGANLPHYGFTDRLTNNKSETIIQMREDFLGEELFEAPEFASIKKLLIKARQCIVFTGKTKKEICNKIEALPHLSPFERVIALLNILKELSESKEYKVLNAEGSWMEIEAKDQNRINAIYGFVKENFQRPIALEEIADLVSMTVPAFCRYFKKVSGKTFTKFVNEYRLVHASKLLSETNMNITDICYECGFNNFSHFNTQFKLFTGKSASAYRNDLTSIVK